MPPPRPQVPQTCALLLSYIHRNEVKVDASLLTSPILLFASPKIWCDERRIHEALHPPYAPHMVDEGGDSPPTTFTDTAVIFNFLAPPKGLEPGALSAKANTLIVKTLRLLSISFYLQVSSTSEGTRTPNLIVRTDVLYPLSYGGKSFLLPTQDKAMLWLTVAEHFI